MRKITFGEPVLKIEGLEARFDVIPVSNSLAILIGDRDTATIVQQLYHWTEKGYGEVIEGVRWFYKSIDEWIREVFPTFTPWKLGKMMKQLADRGIIRREKLFTKHQMQNGDRFWWQPKNQTYYYSLNTDKLQKLADNYKTDGAFKDSNSIRVPAPPETPETPVSIKTQILSNEEIKDTKDFDCAKNNTDITSIENNSKEISHPTLPCVNDVKKGKTDKEKQELSNSELSKIQEVDSVNLKVIEEDTNVGQVEENINQNKGTNKHLVQSNTEQLQKSEQPSPKLRVTKTKQKRTGAVLGVSPMSSPFKKRENKAPWQDELQRSEFYRALIQALPIVANSHSPQGLAKTIIAQLKRGEEHTYWDDFAAGLPIGTSTKPEWEIEPGVPYPMFIEYLIEKIKRGNNTQTTEQARNEVFRILSQPRQATAFWGQFKRSVVNTAEQVERDRALGVSNPNTPIWTRERIEPSIGEAQRAGKKIVAVNGATQAAIESARTPQLESKDSVSVPQSFSSATSTSQNKSEQVSSSPDPWNEDDSEVSRRDTASIYPFRDKPENDKPSLSMREMLAARGVKGFCKPMPKISQAEVDAEERKQIEPKTNIAQMSFDEINDYLKDPVLQKQLTPQLFHSDYELITDYLGQIIGVKLSEVQIQKRQSQSTGE